MASEGSNKKLPTKNDEESSLVDYVIELSNLELIKDFLRFHDCLLSLEL